MVFTNCVMALYGGIYSGMYPEMVQYQKRKDHSILKAGEFFYVLMCMTFESMEVLEELISKSTWLIKMHREEMIWSFKGS